MNAAKPRLAGAAIPYAAVVAGMYLLHSGWAAILLYHLGMLILLACDRRRSWAPLLKQGWRLGWGLTAMTLCLLSGPIVYTLWPLLEVPDIALRDNLAFFGLQGNSWLLFILYFSTAHPILEEIYWRGYLRDDSPGLSPLDPLFAGYHLLVLSFFIRVTWLPLPLAVLTAAGWCWRYLNHKLNGLAVPALSHLAADTAIMIAVWFLGQ